MCGVRGRGALGRAAGEDVEHFLVGDCVGFLDEEDVREAGVHGGLEGAEFLGGCFEG